MKARNPIRKCCIVLFWLAVWHLVSQIVDNDIILVGPLAVAHSFFSLLPTISFWQSVCGSFLKILLGFLLAFCLGILTGAMAFRFPLLEELLAPIVLLMKSVPVAAFVILALIWIGSKNLSILISFLVVFPILYVNTLTGLSSADFKLREMAAVFSVRGLYRLRFIYLPALFPYLKSGCKVALGMAWKSGIAAEVIGVPTHTIGEHLYLSKIYLDTAGLFAWTIVIICVSYGFEVLFLAFLDHLFQKILSSRQSTAQFHKHAHKQRSL